MRISSIQIQKFRSIDNAKLRFEQIIAIVGANNSGKSHVLRALNAFFNYSEEKDSFACHDHMYSSRSRPKITVCFSDIVPADRIPSDFISNDQLTLRFTYRWDRNNPSYEVIDANGARAITTEQFENLTKRFHFIYVPIVRNYDAAICGENGIAYRLLQATFIRKIANKNTIKTHVDRLMAKVESSIFKPAVDDFKKYYPLGSASFSMKASDLDVVDQIMKSVSLYLSEINQKNEINNCGSGIQSAVYFAITMAVQKDDNENCLIGIEEPELNMHPQAQRVLIETLKDQAKYPMAQFILTTHSTVIIDKLGHQAIALCRKSSRQGRDIVTTVSQIDTDIWEKYQITEERYYNFYNYKNSEFFFSDYIIITESPTDCGIIEALLKKYNIDTEKMAISLIPANGEKSIKYPYALATELGIPFICIVDRDVFQPYIGNNRKESLDTNGTPQYKPQIKQSSPILDLFDPSDVERIRMSVESNNYNGLLQIVEEYNIVSMRYALEVDLVVCNSFCNAICDYLTITGDSRCAAFLLKERGNRIKDYDVISNTFHTVPLKNLPKSYREIIKMIKKMIGQ